MKFFKKNIKYVFDLILITSIIFFALKNKGKNSINSKALIKIRSRSYKYSLAKDKVFTIKQDNINYIFEIKSHKIRMVDSPCPKKICIKTGFISNSSEEIICVPEKIIVNIIDDGKNKDYDYMTQ